MQYISGNFQYFARLDGTSECDLSFDVITGAGACEYPHFDDGEDLTIPRSPTADTRTCDVSQVTREQLMKSSSQHICDVSRGLAFFAHKLLQAAVVHDYDKLTEIDHFFADFQTKFAQTGWWDNHRKIHRHHLNHDDGIPADVNLVDVIEYIVDCVMAGRARSGHVYPVEISDEVLGRAYSNTVELLKGRVKVKDEHQENT